MNMFMHHFCDYGGTNGIMGHPLQQIQHCSWYAVMFDPFERVARAHHVCPCCECPLSEEEEDEFVKKQRVKAAISVEHMKVLAVDPSSADSHFQQLDKLRMVYEEYVKIGKETIPNTKKDLHELT